jgi:hypothetical protein
MSPHNNKLLFFKQEETRKQLPYTMKKSIVEGQNAKKKTFDMLS